MPIHEVISVRDVVHLLNDLLVLDKVAIKKLIESRVPCNEAFCDHETVQTMLDPEKKVCVVGILGIINGIFGTFDDGPKRGYGPIMVVYDDDTGEVLRFSRVKNVPESVNIDEGIKED